ncbi:Mannan endo-1,4-beta-mannosidase [Paenibacillus nuruki]|uniref:Mannan endo-1,4-beta-mannosidase n=1 Tax=Paenibacillus nuruki TaxID=1886670 RepID=A0A1E3KYT1_9BACL|nr:S-layer homology domain-containing protein [Paenibacillus nuruki]ODP26697.1 Mannan endo-1,4-beta-mannosidase [Paenibacillus nuruki]
MKKLSICILVLMLILSQPSLAKAASTELKEHWAESLMEDWMSKGILKGYKDGKIYPDRSITRAEFLSLLHKGFDNKNIYDTSKLKDQFKDVSSKNWYYKDVLQAVNEGFIKGYPNNTFQPNKTLTRQEAAVILANKLDLKENKLDILKEYTDSNTVATWATTSFAGVLNYSILTGYPNKTLMPKNQLTRAEAITLLDKAITYQSPTTNPKPVANDITTGSPSSAFTSFGGGGSQTISKLINTLDLNLDSDKDDLPDYMEELIGTDKKNPDSDGDDLTDGQEVNRVGTSPLKADSDGNGIKDALEDNDIDNLNNIKEMQLNTDPNSEDSDFDGWNDGFEIQKKTNPLNADTDNDGLDDSIEEKFEMDPLNSDTNSNGIKDGDESVVYKTEIASYESDPHVTPSVIIASEAKQANTTVITNVYGEDAFINKNIPGYIGAPYEFTTDIDFDTAEMTFEYDPSLQASDFEPAIFYYNKEKQLLEKVSNQTHNLITHSVTATVEHFSTYILLNNKKWDTVWNNEIRIPSVNPSNGRVRDADIIFSIDVSSSMKDNDPKDIRLQAVNNFISKLDANDRASIQQFSFIAVSWAHLTSDKQTVREAVYSVKGFGGTDIYAALEESFNEFRWNGKSDNDKFLVLLTDGKGNDENELVEDMLKNFRENHISIYTIGLGSDIDESNLKHIASSTGGSYFYALTADNIDIAYENVAKETLEQSINIDSDNDGITDYYELNGIPIGNGEILKGLNPNDNDTDNDGIQDGKELVLSPLTDLQGNTYFIILSNPLIKDTDGDGMSDKYDSLPMIYNITERHNVLVSDLSYVNVQHLLGTNLGGILDDNILNRFKDSEAYPDIELDGWKIIKAKDSHWYDSGFGAIALKRGSDIIIAFRGTEASEGIKATNDYLNDAMILLANDNRMAYQAEGFIASIISNNPHSKIHITGHSLGGFLASVTSYELASLKLTSLVGNTIAYRIFEEGNYTFVKGITFNAAPYFITGFFTNPRNKISILTPYTPSAVTLAALQKREYDDQVENYTMEGEFLSLVAKNTGGMRLGRTYTPFPSTGTMMERHAISNFYEYFHLK